MHAYPRNAIWCAIALPSLALMVVAPCQADDWPQWRGPKRDGVWRETGTIEKFSSAQLPTVWRAAIGSGYSGPTVAAGRVYVTDRSVEPKQTERIVCFDELSGKQLWEHVYDCQYSIGYPAGPRASVSIDEGRAYALGAMGDLFCLDAATGKVHWRKDLLIEYGIQMPIWGIAASPLVRAGLVIVQIGGQDGACLVAFDKLSGKETWRSLNDRASYCAPILIEQAGQQYLACLTGDHVVALEPATGKLVWQYPFPPTRMVISIATPIVQNDKLFVTSFYDGSLMLRLRTDRPVAEKLWRRQGADERSTDGLHSIMSTPLLDGEYLYGVDSYGELRCLRADTGERVWEDQTATPRARWSNIHMVRNGDRVWMFNERGELVIARLSPQRFEEISRAKLIDPTTEQLRQRGGVCWSHPAYANRRVFARSDKEIVCANLAR